ncbi:MAG: tRNA pseudouridine(13) synthase TruD [Campylobacterota bacterium]|nr:tRNA pseudouridine(13) synthase TruD [Campylobacterota bacterium]
MQTTRIFLQTHEPLKFTFNQNRFDFIVQEIPLGEFTNKGNFFILKIKKEYTSTWELISYISKKLDIAENLIGYAGLKDKNATTTQYISIPLNKSRDYKCLNSKNIKVLDTYIHNQKIKIGDLKGNSFKITLKDIDSSDLPIIYQTLSQIQKNGMPNYFGYQRFGQDNNFEKTKNIVYGEELLSDKRLKSFLTSAYQSYFFNAWLAKRVEMSQENNSKKLLCLEGDLFKNKDKKIITGLMPGRKVLRSKDEAGKLESSYDDIFIHDKGYRRDAWIMPTNIQNRYNKENNSMLLEFTLPKSSYATVFIENISNKNYSYK